MKFKIALVDLLLAEYVLGHICVGRRTEDEFLAAPLGQVYRSCFCFQQKSSDRFKSRLISSFVLHCGTSIQELIKKNNLHFSTTINLNCL